MRAHTLQRRHQTQLHRIIGIAHRAASCGPPPSPSALASEVRRGAVRSARLFVAFHLCVSSVCCLQVVVVAVLAAVAASAVIAVDAAAVAAAQVDAAVALLAVVPAVVVAVVAAVLEVA